MTAKPTVMIVDDDEDIREIVGEILGDASYDVVAARNGREALDQLASTTPQLILLDLNMPVMDGIAFRHAQRADARFAKIPTVVMSAIHQMQQRIADLGFEHAMAKPVDLKELLRVVARFTRSP